MADKPQDAGSGSLRRNAKKERPSQPDYLGSIEIRGRKFWLSGWINEADDGSKWLKLAVRDADEQPAPKPKQAAGRQFSDESPFGPEWR
jgi:hypothetical protein